MRRRTTTSSQTNMSTRRSSNRPCRSRPDNGQAHKQCTSAGAGSKLLEFHRGRDSAQVRRRGFKRQGMAEEGKKGGMRDVAVMDTMLLH